MKGLARIVELWPALNSEAQAAILALARQLANATPSSAAVLPDKIGGPVPNMAKLMPSPEKPRACVQEVPGEVERVEPAEETEEGKQP